MDNLIQNKALCWILLINFHCAVWFSIIGGIIIINRPELVFFDPEGIFGPLRNNLIFITIYLVVQQALLWYFRYLKNGRHEALFMGLVFLMAAGGTPFYSEINAIPVADELIHAEWYIALSHVLFFMATPAPKTNGQKSNAS